MKRKIWEWFPGARSFKLSLLCIALAISPTVYAQTGSGKNTTASPPTTDIGWPRMVKNDKGTLVYYQPQLDDWKDHLTLSGRMAFALTPSGKQEVHGVASIDANTIVDKESRTVFLRDITPKDIRFPGADETQAKSLEELFKTLLPTGGETISIDRLVADLKNTEVKPPTVEVKNDPPPIFYYAGSAILLIVQGEAVLNPIAKTDLQYVVNTNWDLFFDKSTKEYYLLNDKTWLTAKELGGPWKATQKLPKDMSKLPSGENFDEVKKAIPATAVPASVPKVFYSDKPAELILFKGAPVYTKIQGTNLLYVANTDNDIFLDDATKTFYVLLSGRWFSATDFNGPWSYAGDQLPADFAKIPETSHMGHVLASVPGTVQASDAVMLAQIPTTAVVNKKEAEAKVKVTYDGGTADFKNIEGTSLQYATNTQEKVIKFGDLYYLCFQAVWFMSTSPAGPWTTCDIVPKEIYSIPPSSPMYNVTYVTQTNATETTVESSTAAGYFGAFIIGVGIGACIAYGTGWYYPPYMWWGPGMIYPVWRPWPYAYGGGFVYNPWTGGFYGGRMAYGPYGAIGSSAWYNPATGRYGRAASVQGWYGGRTVAGGYNPWTGGYAGTRQGHNPYAQWGTSVAGRGNQWVQTGHVTTARGTTAAYRTAGGQSGVIHHGQNGTIAKGANGTFVGHDGNIYRKNADGSWSQHTKNGWQHQVGGGGSGTRNPDLNRAAHARERGQFQTQRFQRMGGARMGGFRRR